MHLTDATFVVRWNGAHRVATFHAQDGADDKAGIFIPVGDLDEAEKLLGVLEPGPSAPKKRAKRSPAPLTEPGLPAGGPGSTGAGETPKPAPAGGSDAPPASVKPAASGQEGKKLLACGGTHCRDDGKTEHHDPATCPRFQKRTTPADGKRHAREIREGLENGAGSEKAAGAAANG